MISVPTAAESRFNPNINHTVDTPVDIPVDTKREATSLCADGEHPFDGLGYPAPSREHVFR